MNCLNCGIKNKNSNFCNKCGFKLKIIDICDVCRERKELKPLTCGHSFCGDCLFSISLTDTKHCPKCRKKFNKCYNCYNFRVKNKVCLDCNTREKVYLCNHCFYIYKGFNYSYRTLDECVNCKKKNIDLIPVDHSDINNVKIKSKEQVNPVMIEVCHICLSSDFITTESGINMCYHCNKLNTKIIKVPENIVSLLPILDKELVNPEKIEVCENCFSDDLSITNNSSDKYCNNCNLNTNGIKILRKFQNYYPIIDKKFINPNKIRICKYCFNDKFIIKDINKNTSIICTLCQHTLDDTMFINEENRDLYPIKQI